MSELKFKQVKWLPIGKGLTAIVMPWGVCYHTKPMSDRLARHERVHWEQYKRHGRFRFVFMYLLENIRRGYKKNKYEIEARKAESVNGENDT